MRILVILWGAVALGAACDPGAVGGDAAGADAAGADAAGADAAGADAAGADAAPADAAVADAAPADAAVADAAVADAAPADAAVADAAPADAAVADAAVPDASSPDATPPRVMVRVFDAAGVLRPGAPVVRQRGELVLATTQTDAAGLATLAVEPGDTVTAGFSDARADGSVVHRLVTWQDVQPGDLLTCGEQGLGDEIATLRVFAPEPFSSAHHYGVSSGCGEGGGGFTDLPVEYPLHAGCHPDAAHVPVILWAFDEFDSFLAYTAGEGAIVDGVAQPVLPAWRTDLFSFTNRFTNLPAGADAWGQFVIVGAGRELFQFAVAPIAPFSNEGSVRLPLGLGTSWIYVDGFAQAQPGGSALRRRVLAGPMPLPASASLDGVDVLPKVVALTFSGSAPERTAIGWSLDGAGDAVDAVLVSTALVTQDGPLTWTVVAGPGTTSVRLPPLPDAMAAYRPTAPPAAITHVIVYADDDAPGAAAYRDFRALLSGAPFDVPDLETRITARGARHLRTSEYSFDARL